MDNKRRSLDDVYNEFSAFRGSVNTKSTNQISVVMALLKAMNEKHKPEENEEINLTLDNDDVVVNKITFERWEPPLRTEVERFKMIE